MLKPKPIYSWDKIPVVVDPALAGLLLGLHPDTVARMCKSGEIKAFRVGRFWRINRTELKRICGECENEPVGIAT